MTVRRQVNEPFGVFFITFTCYRWLHLFSLTDCYDEIYHQFDILRSEGHHITGYVIMPNHLHALIGLANTGISINHRVGTIKRFLSYDIVERLQSAGQTEILEILSAGVNPTERSRGKLHAVFEPSFDCKICLTRKFIEQKLDYMHNNPCSPRWKLVENPVDYVHSSARFYILGEPGYYPVTSFLALEDIDLATFRKNL